MTDRKKLPEHFDASFFEELEKATGYPGLYFAQVLGWAPRRYYNAKNRSNSKAERLPRRAFQLLFRASGLPLAKFARLLLYGTSNKSGD